MDFYIQHWEKEFIYAMLFASFAASNVKWSKIESRLVE